MAITRSTVGVLLRRFILSEETLTCFRYFHLSTNYFEPTGWRREKDNMASKSKKVQPPWNPPKGTEVPKLKLYNSLTRQKVPWRLNRRETNRRGTVNWYPGAWFSARGD